MTIGGIQYTNPLDFGQNAPYNGVDILHNRKGGWLVRHPAMGWQDGKVGTWIDIPDRAVADKVHEALCMVFENTMKIAEQMVDAEKMKSYPPYRQPQSDNQDNG